jgi:glycine dehydrogenase
MVQDLTGMEIANASLLDEGTALAEAVTMAYQIQKRKVEKIFVLEPLFPQSLAVLETRCEPIGVEVVKGTTLPENLDDFFAVVTQYPNGLGSIKQCRSPLTESGRIEGLESCCGRPVESVPSQSAR